MTLSLSVFLPIAQNIYVELLTGKGHED
jgi:hypothetical protein